MWFTDAFWDLVAGAGCVGCGRPGRLWCADCERGLPQRATRVRPSPCPVGLAPAMATAEYAGSVAAMIVGHKEHAQLALARPLGRLLATAVRGLFPEPTPLLLVPVPSRAAVRRRRGHDPLGSMLRIASAELAGTGHRARPADLLVTRGTPQDQSGLGAAERARNLAGAMACPSHRVRRWHRHGAGHQVVVCDDVLTTGATAREAQRALEVAGIAVAGVACVAATRRRTPAAGRPGPTTDPLIGPLIGPASDSAGGALSSRTRFD